MYEFQKASIPKRIAAWLIDTVLLLTLALGFNFLMSLITGYDSYSERLDAVYDRYEQEYNTDFDLLPDTDEFEALDEAAKARYEIAVKKLSEDEEANALYNKVMTLIILNVTVSVLIATLIIEFVVPILFGNGMTVGKKLFGLSVIKTDIVKVTTFQLLVRAILGKYTIEIMLPTLIIIMVYFGNLGIIGLGVLLLLGLIQLVLIIATRKNQPIHDLISECCVADYLSQSVFATEEEREKYTVGTIEN